MDNRILNATLEYLSKIFLPSINGSIKGSSKDISDTLNKSVKTLNESISKSSEETNRSLEPIKELSESLKELGNLKEIFLGISQIKGDKGDTPEKGVDYLTDKELAEIKEESTPIKGIDYFDGKDGYTPVKGKDYFTDKEVKEFLKKSTPVKGKDYRDGIDGKDGINGINGIDGKDGSPDKPKDIVSKLESLEGEDRLDVSAIKGIEKLSNAGKAGFGKAVKYLRNLLDVEISSPTNGQALVYNSTTKKWENGTVPGPGTGVVETIVAGSNITVDATDPANPIVSASLPSGSGITRTIISTSGNYTASATAGIDYEYLISGAHTTTLPTCVGNTNKYTFKNNHSTNVTINAAGGETIDGAASLSLGPQEAIDLTSDNSSNWNIS